MSFTSDILFTPYKLGPFQLQHRMVYAPLTRSRAKGTIPQPNAVQYYSQRATLGGFMLTEATVVAPTGHGFPDTPGIYTKEHVEAWKPVVKAVKAKGAVFFNQIWHVGRASHTDYQPNGALPVGPSANGVENFEVWLENDGGAYKKGKFTVPRELTKAEIADLVQAYAAGARNALEAGFDGVEIHGGNGYLIDQFLKDSINKRTDEYGGSFENRCRFALEVVEAVVAAVGADRVGIRISPFTEYLDARDTDTYGLIGYLVQQLNPFGLAYLHMIEPRVVGSFDRETPESLEPFRKAWKGTFMAAGGYTQKNAVEALESGHTDLVVFGRLWLANPDLPERFRLHAPLNKYDRDTFYSPNQVVGYIDYPFFDEAAMQSRGGPSTILVEPVQPEGQAPLVPQAPAVAVQA